MNRSRNRPVFPAVTDGAVSDGAWIGSSGGETWWSVVLVVCSSALVGVLAFDSATLIRVSTIGTVSLVLAMVLSTALYFCETGQRASWMASSGHEVDAALAGHERYRDVGGPERLTTPSAQHSLDEVGPKVDANGR